MRRSNPARDQADVIEDEDAAMFVRRL